MEQTFMTIHNLSPEANILFASESIYDILGYHPHEVHNRSCFDYFHPEEVPFAKSIHNRGVLLDKAAVLHYARILSRDGQWISCECCFTIVHDVLVACTSIYHRGEKSDRRALEAPQIRRLFSCSPRDPRYHMLEYLSPKFRMPSAEREPRAALILNRFTRTLTVMFATNAVANILGVDADTMRGKSFYECIQENCLPDAIRCLESAKANDSIAYLRFWYRDPRRPGDMDDEDMDDVDGQDGQRRRRHGARASTHSSDSEGGGAQLYGQMDVDGQSPRPRIKVEEGEERPGLVHADSSSTLANPMAGQSGSSSGHVQTPASPPLRRNSPSPMPEDGSQEPDDGSFELEAVVSCTSDGLVVVLRRARPAIPTENPPAVNPPAAVPRPRPYQNGIFAAPWGHHAVGPWGLPAQAQGQGNGMFPQPAYNNELVSSTPSDQSSGGPPLDYLMRSIREVAVFAWALVGINGNLATYGRGTARGQARPAGGLPVWDPAADGSISYGGPENQAVKRWAAYDRAKRTAPSVFNGPYQLSRTVHHAPQPVDFGYSTQSNELFPYAEPPSVRQAWARYRQQQLEHQARDHQPQPPHQQPPAYQEYQPSTGYSYGTPSWNGPQLPYPSIQAEPFRFGAQPAPNGHDQRPRYQPEYQGQPWAQDPDQPQADGSGHFDVSSNGNANGHNGHNGHNGQNGHSQNNRFPWN